MIDFGFSTDTLISSWNLQTGDGASTIYLGTTSSNNVSNNDNNNDSVLRLTVFLNSAKHKHSNK